MGTYRAIKVVFRRTFEHRRPYDREFDGIKRYEPVSRTHPSQVTVLHVGRHEEDDYYYYVMDLADDATAQPGDGKDGESRKTPSEGRTLALQLKDPAAYAPRTLQSDLKQRGKLPLDECVTLGLALVTALQHLHENGLIHRDVKPGNVVFINGVPKLTDGLVAEIDTSMSYVGTRGYFPPEGPGTVQADLYSLGKVLYEISTGKDRNEFPDLPNDLDDLTDESRFLEFNEILLKACHGDPKQRYGSARELLADLALMREGKSIRQKRGRERMIAGLGKAAVAAALVMLVATIGYLAARKPTKLGSGLPRHFCSSARFNGLTAGSRLGFCWPPRLYLTSSTTAAWARDVHLNGHSRNQRR